MNILDYIRSLLNNNKKISTIYTQTLKKTFNSQEALEIGLYSGDTPIVNAEVGIEINGVQYIRNTDNNGVARLNINLGGGKYTAKCYYPGNKEYNKASAYAEVFITTDTYMDGINLKKTVGDSTPYQCAVYRLDNNQRVKDEVTFNINGQPYTRNADEDGLYKLNINLPIGTYTIEASFNGNELFNPSSIKNTITIEEPAPEPEPTPEPKSYAEKLLEYFESKFGPMSCIDDCLEAVQGRGYAYYYDDQFDNYTAINRMADEEGDNCTDACQVFWNLSKALGYDVKCLHIGCSGGDGHVRLQLKHPINTDDEWINRDPAAVLNGGSIDSIWCENGTIWDINPDWFMANIER